MITYGTSATDTGEVKRKANIGNTVWIRDRLDPRFLDFTEAIFLGVDPFFMNTFPYRAQPTDRSLNILERNFPEIRLTKPN